MPAPCQLQPIFIHHTNSLRVRGGRTGRNPLLSNPAPFTHDWLELPVSILDVFEFFIWTLGIRRSSATVSSTDSVSWTFVYLKKCWRWHLSKFDIHGNKAFLCFYRSLCISRSCSIRFRIFGAYIRIRYYIYKSIYSTWISNSTGICISDKYYINHKKILDTGIFGSIYILHHYLILRYI